MIRRHGRPRVGSEQALVLAGERTAGGGVWGERLGNGFGIGFASGVWQLEDSIGVCYVRGKVQYRARLASARRYRCRVVHGCGLRCTAGTRRA